MAHSNAEIELRDAVEVTRNEYLELVEQHECLVANAQCDDRGSTGMLQSLLFSTELGPHVSMALRRYLDALETLTVFYQSIHCPDDDVCNGDETSCTTVTGARDSRGIVRVLRRAD
jgi:hypothetical protein